MKRAPSPKAAITLSVYRMRAERSFLRQAKGKARMSEGVNGLLPVAAQRGLGMPQFDPKESLG